MSLRAMALVSSFMNLFLLRLSFRILVSLHSWTLAYTHKVCISLARHSSENAAQRFANSWRTQ